VGNAHSGVFDRTNSTLKMFRKIEEAMSRILSYLYYVLNNIALLQLIGRPCADVTVQGVKALFLLGFLVA
jgi:hypothetical protein